MILVGGKVVKEGHNSPKSFNYEAYKGKVVNERHNNVEFLKPEFCK